MAASAAVRFLWKRSVPLARFWRGDCGWRSVPGCFWSWRRGKSVGPRINVVNLPAAGRKFSSATYKKLGFRSCRRKIHKHHVQKLDFSSVVEGGKRKSRRNMAKIEVVEVKRSTDDGQNWVIW